MPRPNERASTSFSTCSAPPRARSAPPEGHRRPSAQHECPPEPRWACARPPGTEPTLEQLTACSPHHLTSVSSPAPLILRIGATAAHSSAALGKQRPRRVKGTGLGASTVPSEGRRIGSTLRAGPYLVLPTPRCYHCASPHPGTFLVCCALAMPSLVRPRLAAPAVPAWRTSRSVSSSGPAMPGTFLVRRSRRAS